MSQSETRSELAQSIAEDFSRYFEHMAQRVEHFARAVPETALWTKPFPFGNSIGHLVLHLTGNLNHYVGAAIAGTGYVREREKEFTDATNPPLNELLSSFHQAVAMVVQTLQSLDDAGFQVAVEHNVPIRTRLGLLLVCAAHMNNHLGQMSYLAQALQPEAGQKPQW